MPCADGGASFQADIVGVIQNAKALEAAPIYQRRGSPVAKRDAVSSFEHHRPATCAGIKRKFFSAQSFALTTLTQRHYR